MMPISFVWGGQAFEAHRNNLGSPSIKRIGSTSLKRQDTTKKTSMVSSVKTSVSDFLESQLILGSTYCPD
jgi:hypothetical protein